MAEKEGTVEERVVPPRPKQRKKWPEYYEQNKEAILADYRSMTIRAFLKRWGIATTTWIKLKQKWGVPNKISKAGPKLKPRKVSNADQHRFIEEHKEEILKDIGLLTREEVLKKWGIGTNTYSQLSKGMVRVKAVAGKEYKEPQPRPSEFCLLITEEDLAKLDDDDFRLIWVVLGRIIKNRLKS